MDVKGKRILVCGLARSGLAAARLLAQSGACVTAYDAKDEGSLTGDFDALRALGCRLVFGGDPLELEAGMDLIVISPGIPWKAPLVQAALSNDIEVIGELELGARLTRGRLVAITGTNGKTTTTTLTGEFFRSTGKTTHVVGNIGYPITETAGISRPDDVTVAEVSSYQCESVSTFHPDVAACLNITEDHLARHGTMEEYVRMKRRIFLQQTPRDVAVFNYDDETCRRMAEGLRAHVAWFSRKTRVPYGAYAEDGVVYLALEQTHAVCRCDEIRIPGSHNLENALAAVAIAGALGVPCENMREVLSTFPGVEHRIETVRELDGVTWINDSKGTNVDSTLKAIDTMTRPTVLILGGSDKKVSFDKLAEAVAGSGLIRHCVLIGDTAGQIRAALEAKGYTDFEMAGYDFDACLARCRSLAVPGGCVLLSPACASFDMFRDYEDRGRIFKKKVLALT
ncbi:MAG: UDP-N-acetylmuramoyl-L-alanine--D-glutamate ligase [Clostridia bacterium]|nr:UDP-N-acetylmuramoyl-L-alanine--D-glutamate ligase [Clostridia bacterium]